MNEIHNGRGYCGISLSVNAFNAYQEGKMPLSKWKKKDIIECIERIAEKEGLLIDKKKVNKITLPILKKELLFSKEWHHTSMRYNITDFYEINYSKVKKLVDDAYVESLIDKSIQLSEKKKEDKKQKNAEKKLQKPERWSCEYDEIKGLKGQFRKTIKAEGIVLGDWITLDNGKRKRVSGSHFRLLKRLA